jgi:N-ATPase, AtpR subunit
MQSALHVLAFLFVGILLGAGYFALLRASVTQLARGVSSGQAIVTHLLRLAAAVLMFWIVAQYGATALLASLAGFTVVLATLRPLTAP